ncbi:hypothetical protein FRC19_006476 [Serendipita sp. 401]|nr:hypothetical protein FRC19_006476 [Serendipita sp. 401]
MERLVCHVACKIVDSTNQIEANIAECVVTVLGIAIYQIGGRALKGTTHIEIWPGQREPELPYLSPQMPPIRKENSALRLG